MLFTKVRPTKPATLDNSDADQGGSGGGHRSSPHTKPVVVNPVPKVAAGNKGFFAGNTVPQKPDSARKVVSRSSSGLNATRYFTESAKKAPPPAPINTSNAVLNNLNPSQRRGLGKK